jgi:decaprenylphospho-beta-D-ribofuranose 2-oxidase
VGGASSNRDLRMTSPESEIEQKLLVGWGRTSPTLADLVQARSDHEVVSAVQSVNNRGIIARGLGRGYGDCAQNAGGLVLNAQHDLGFLMSTLHAHRCEFSLERAWTS